MQYPIYRVIAEPQKFLWAPRAHVLLNFMIQIAVMLLMAPIQPLNPLMVMISIAIVHIGLIVWGFINPHAVSWLACIAVPRASTRNLIRPTRSARRKRYFGAQKYGQ